MELEQALMGVINSDYLVILASRTEGAHKIHPMPNIFCNPQSRNHTELVYSETYRNHIKKFHFSCPETRDIPVGELVGCQWYGADSGQNINCPENMSVFGQCSTNKNIGNGGDCNKLSHQAECCGSDITLDMAMCGWIYGTYGEKITCPSGLTGAGFCSVNNKSDCKDGKHFAGIKCCPPAAGGIGGQ